MYTQGKRDGSFSSPKQKSSHDSIPFFSLLFTSLIPHSLLVSAYFSVRKGGSLFLSLSLFFFFFGLVFISFGVGFVFSFCLGFNVSL